MYKYNQIPFVTFREEVVHSNIIKLTPFGLTPMCQKDASSFDQIPTSGVIEEVNFVNCLKDMNAGQHGMAFYKVS